MGEQDISIGGDNKAKRDFTRAVLNDLRALELMMQKGLIESGARRIGAEQEMCITDDHYGPKCVAGEILQGIDDERLTNEVALFNLEANLTPLHFNGKCLSQMEEEIKEVVSLVKQHADKQQAKIILAGILPTLRQMDLSMDNITPKDRYYELNERLKQLRGGDFRLDIRGIDELAVTHDSFMLEALNTSFQIHFQVSGDEFVDMYNMSQAITAPLLAVSTNSGLIHHYRLWHESRIAVFQNSIDTRSTTHMARGNNPRVHFGDAWIDSIFDVFQDDISRFSVMLTSDFEENPVQMVEQGITPKLKALMLHNGTVYRWNRPCYGVVDNVPHLRIENRVLPAGPSIVDEIANAAFYFGMLAGLSRKKEFDIRQEMRFSTVRNNFLQACRTGLESHFTWLDGKSHTAADLVNKQLLPEAAAGLTAAGLDKDDIEHYLGIIERRVAKQQTGAIWAIRSITEMDKNIHPDEQVRSLVAEMDKQQSNDTPIADWPLAKVNKNLDWRATFSRLGQFMTTKILTVAPDDSIELAASIMNWKHVRHVPVESESGELVGLVSHRAIMKKVIDNNDQESPAVKEIMNPEPIFAHPQTATIKAIQLMREEKISCLPIVENQKLVGVISEHDLILIAGHLLEEFLQDYENKQQQK